MNPNIFVASFMPKCLLFKTQGPGSALNNMNICLSSFFLKDWISESFYTENISHVDQIYRGVDLGSSSCSSLPFSALIVQKNVMLCVKIHLFLITFHPVLSCCLLHFVAALMWKKWLKHFPTLSLICHCLFSNVSESLSFKALSQC